MRRWMFIFPALLLFGSAVLMNGTETFVAVGVIGGFVCLAAGGYAGASHGAGGG